MAEGPFKLVDAMSELIEAEQNSPDRVDFHRLSGAMHERRRDLLLDGTENTSAWVDAVAFGLEANAEHEEPWHLYFGPMGSGIDNDGKKVFFPEVRELDERALDLWEGRLRQSNHPAFRARYSDLLWEIGSPLGRKAKNPDHAREAIGAYEAMVVEDKCQAYFEPDQATLRMLTLSILIRDESAVERAKKLLVDQHITALKSDRRVNLDVVDRLLWGRGVNLGGEAVTAIVADLEGVLAKSVADTDGFDPFLARYVANRLQKHYGRNRSMADVRRVHGTVGEAFEKLAALGNGLASSSHLDMAASEFSKAGDTVSHSRTRIARAEAVKRSNSEMVPLSFDMKVTFEEMEQFLQWLVGDRMPQVGLMRVANRFVEKSERLAQQILENANKAPIQAMLNITIHEDQHVAAIIGSVADDLEGRVLHEAGRGVGIEGLFLRSALERIVEMHDLTPDDIAGWAGRLGAFDDLVFVLEGVEAWFDGDFVKASHVLIPQIEAGLRTTLKLLGQPIVRDHPTMPGRQLLLNMAEVLSTAALQQEFGEDLVLYFRSRYVDPRGLNFRNIVAHGIPGRSTASSETCDVLIHTLLVLGCWREIAASRKAH